METINYIMKNYGEILLLINVGAILMLFIVILSQGVTIRKMKEKHKQLFKGSNINNIEDLLIKHNKEIDSIKYTNKGIVKDVNNIMAQLKETFSKTSILNYDAFGERAGKLSFVYVLLDKYNSGVIINGIYNKDGHYLYLKEVIKGVAQKDLSKEEKQTLLNAMQTEEKRNAV